MDTFYSIAKMAILITILVVLFGSAAGAADWWQSFFSSMGTFIGELQR